MQTSIADMSLSCSIATKRQNRTPLRCRDEWSNTTKSGGTSWNGASTEPTARTAGICAHVREINWLLSLPATHGQALASAWTRTMPGPLKVHRAPLRPPKANSGAQRFPKPMVDQSQWWWVQGETKARLRDQL